MSEFDSPADIPFQLKIEGEKINVVWQPGVPTQSTPGVPNSAQGTISWNIPSPARGCATVADGTSAYCGALVLVSTQPLTAAEQPTNGTLYTPDPSVNPDTHAGDRIGNAMVVGMFLEGEKKANGEEMTVSMIVNDVDANTPYYVAVHAMDCQFRYHTAGSFAYSREYGGAGTEDTPGRQTVVLGSGVEASDNLPAAFCTGGSPSPVYGFDLLVTDTYPEVSQEQIYPVLVESANICTYGELVDEIRRQLIIQTVNRSDISQPIDPDNIMTDPPLTGQLAVVDGVLLQFDGTTYNTIDGAYFEPEDPADVAIGDYWYNPDTGELKRDRVPNPNPPVTANGWNDVDVTVHNEDPRTLAGCDDYWFDGTKAYKWCTTTWCEQVLYISTTDPSAAPTYDCTLFWFDETNDQLYEWNSRESRWVETVAIMWDEAPNALSIGTYWFNDTTEELFSKTVSGWSAAIPVTISDSEPTLPAANMYWYNASTEELKQRDPTNTFWTDLAVLVWPEDPTDMESCDKWWKPGTPDQMYLWDSVHLEWDQTPTFIISEEDPFTPPTIETESLWYNPDTETMSFWDGVQWIEVSYIQDSNDPTLPTTGSAWFNPETNEWFIWDTPTAGQWNPIDPIDSTIDPKTIPDGAYWFDTVNELLYVRNAGAWDSVTYSTTAVVPVKGSLWYDVTEGVLKEWNGTEWVPSYQVPVDVQLNEDGNLKFTTTEAGSNNVVMVMVPEAIPSGEAGIVSAGCQPVYTTLTTHSFAFYGPQSCPTPLSVLRDQAAATSGVNASNFLFGPSAIGIAKIYPQAHGFDGVSDLPSYIEPGVGTDGTSDERKALSNYVREMLGYPVVEVELTGEQINNSIRRALDVFRQKSSLAYKRGFFFLDVHPGVQHYTLTSRVNGYNKIVNIMGAYRFTSAFLSSAHGSGVYGQVVLQHLYNMGTFDLTSYHLISQYIEQLEHLFATRLTFHWDEPTRTFTLYTTFTRPERLLIETTVERTEQEILLDRWSKNWIERWSLTEAQLVLARIRGKYASLPGAGGGVSLDAADLMSRAEAEQDKLILELEDYYAQDIEDYGMGTSFVIG